jgi:hypothetical protein
LKFFAKKKAVKIDLEGNNYFVLLQILLSTSWHFFKILSFVRNFFYLKYKSMKKPLFDCKVVKTITFNNLARCKWLNFWFKNFRCPRLVILDVAQTRVTADGIALFVACHPNVVRINHEESFRGLTFARRQALQVSHKLIDSFQYKVD